MGETEHSFKNLKEVESIALAMVANYNKFGQVTPKTELQQIKDILISLITINQAEKYSYVAIDSDGETCLFIDKPETDGVYALWTTPDMHTDENYLTLDGACDNLDLNTYIRENATTLCFLIADLKGRTNLNQTGEKSPQKKETNMDIKLNTVYALETKKTFTIKEGTKTVWQLDKKEENNITEEQYDNTTSIKTQQWFRGIGGSEYAIKGYTRKGYLVTELISKSPDRQTKVTRSFNFGISPTGATL
jgi:hypothetical protein